MSVDPKPAFGPEPVGDREGSQRTRATVARRPGAMVTPQMHAARRAAVPWGRDREAGGALPPLRSTVEARTSRHPITAQRKDR